MVSIMRLDINTSTIIRGNSGAREKSLAFEFFLDSDNPCYKESYKIVKNDNIGNKVRAELLTIRRALTRCSGIKSFKNVNINIFIEEDDTLELLDKMSDIEKHSLTVQDATQLRKINNLITNLTNKGCKISYNKDRYKESTAQLANEILKSKQNLIQENNIESALASVKNKSTVSNNDNISDVTMEESPEAIINALEESLMAEETRNTETIISDTIDMSNFLKKVNEELQIVCSKLNSIENEIIKANEKISILEAYGSSLNNNNLSIATENIELNKEIVRTQEEIHCLLNEINSLELDIDNNEDTLLALNQKIKCTNKELAEQFNSDKSTIEYLQKEIERLIIQEKFLEGTF